jgi:cytochrome b6-f complex iron-sulfur subunit
LGVEGCPHKVLTRRRFLNYVFNGGLLGLLGATLYPIARYIYPPIASKSSVSRVLAAKLGELTRNTAKIFRFGARPAILINTPAGKLKAFTAVCTHLDCTVQYDSDSSVIWCACHKGKFDLNGQVISGPPPRPLEAYQVNIQGDDVVVSKST